MKFYIFANDSDVIIESAKNAIHQSDTYSDILKMYEDMIRRYKYSNIYLIVDFEFKHSTMFGYDSLEDLNNQVVVPFLIIREFHYDHNMNCNALDKNGKMDPELTIRKDSVVLETNGFAQFFKNNELVLNKFIYCIENSIPATMQLVFENSDYVYKRKIASSIEVLRGNPISLKKIKIDKNNIHFNNYDFNKSKTYNFA
jgi:hypothetical protein